MIKKVTFEEFEKVYLDVVESVLEHYTPEMQQEMSQHCVDWGPDVYDFSVYLRSSAERYYIAYKEIYKSGAKTVCEVGGFWGVFPITLARFDFKVCMTEALKYYSSAFDDLFIYIRTQNVEIIDYDPFQEEASTLNKEFDAISLIAVLEHYPHSHAFLMSNIRTMLKSDGLFFVEVPNIAYWPKRWGFLFGKSPLVSMTCKYRSKIPFIGHHHEFTYEDLIELLKLANFQPKEPYFINYSRLTPQSLRGWLSSLKSGQIFFHIITHLFPQTRELILLASTKIN